MASGLDRLEALRRRLDAMAAGYWRLDGDHRLIQVGFVASDALPVDAASLFAATTRIVPLDRTDLGIVAAFLIGRRYVSVVPKLPSQEGSGFWLRMFGASRSVAVPIGRGVVSVALTGIEPDEDEVERVLLEEVGASDSWDDLFPFPWIPS